MMMRFLFIFALLILSVAGAAGVAEGKNTHATPRWVDIDRTTRATIVAAWLALPEGTRPPFPVFRDAQMGLRGTHQPKK